MNLVKVFRNAPVDKFSTSSSYNVAVMTAQMESVGCKGFKRHFGAQKTNSTVIWRTLTSNHNPQFRTPERAMSKKKIRTSLGTSQIPAIHQTRSLSPLPANLDVFSSLSSLISDHETLASAAVSFVGWKTVESMLPPCLQGRSREDIIQLVSDELDGMSKRRISRVLEGESVSTSSSSSEVSEDDQENRYNEEDGENGSEGIERSSTYLNCGSDSEQGHSFCSLHESEVPPSESEADSYSDVELIEGLDTDSNNLPDVNET